MVHKEFKPTQEMIDAAGKVFFCQAHLKITEPVIRAFEKKLLDEMQIKEKDGTLISNADNIFLAHEDDQNKYFEQMNVLLASNGYEEFAKTGKCPLLVAKNQLSAAENHLIEVIEPISNIGMNDLYNSSDFLADRKKLVDLNLSLLAPFINSKDILEKEGVANA